MNAILSCMKTDVNYTGLVGGTNNAFRCYFVWWALNFLASFVLPTVILQAKTDVHLDSSIRTFFNLQAEYIAIVCNTESRKTFTVILKEAVAKYWRV